MNASPCLGEAPRGGRFGGRRVVPRISSFYGIVVRMYWDERDHPVAHFHVDYAGELASIALDGAVLGGSVPPRALALVREWTQLHRPELQANWERARKREPLEKIEPLP